MDEPQQEIKLPREDDVLEQVMRAFHLYEEDETHVGDRVREVAAVTNQFFAQDKYKLTRDLNVRG